MKIPKNVIFQKQWLWQLQKKLSFPKYGGNMNSAFAVVDSHGV